MGAERPAHGTAAPERVLATARCLTRLLADPAYRSSWSKYATRRGGPVHQGGVAQVLAEHLYDSAQVSEGDQDLPRRLKDIVSRALAGRVLSPPTLRLFVDAFRFGPMHAAELWGLYTGADPARLTLVRDPGDLHDGPEPPTNYQTIACHEFHTVGADGLPAEHRTVHVVRAVAPVSTYAYRFDTNAAVVQVIRGGSAGPVRRTTIPGIYAVDIILQRPLLPGQTASFEYRTVFSYRTPPPPEFRRGSSQLVGNLEINVRFHPERTPRLVEWAVWDGINARHPSHVEPVLLEPDHSVHRYLDGLAGHLVGFRWRFRDRTP